MIDDKYPPAPTMSESEAIDLYKPSYEPARNGVEDNPKWDAMLDELWPDGSDDVARLRAWFGYALTPHEERRTTIACFGEWHTAQNAVGRMLCTMPGIHAQLGETPAPHYRTGLLFMMSPTPKVGNWDGPGQWVNDLEPLRQVFLEFPVNYFYTPPDRHRFDIGSRWLHNWAVGGLRKHIEDLATGDTIADRGLALKQSMTSGS